MDQRRKSGADVTPEVRAALEGLGDNRAKVDELSRRLSTLEAVADELAADYGTGRISRRTLQRATEANSGERQAIERKITDLLSASSPILADAPRTEVALRRWWDGSSDVRRRGLIGALLERINIGPGRRGPVGFQVDRVNVIWRG